MSSITAPVTVARERSAARLAAGTLVGLVLVSAVLRAWAAGKHAGPAYFPDEYLYAELSRSLSATGHADVRGAASHFAPLLAPLLTAPAWRLGSVVDGYHAAQAINSLVASLAAVPVYVLVRTLRIGRPLALASAALALLLPGLLYTGFMLSEPIAYPLVLATVAAGVRLIARPSRANGAAFAGFVLLSTFARLQFAILLPCFIVALLVVLAREGRLRETLRRHWRASCGIVVATAALGVAGPARSTGYYPSFLHVGIHPVGIVSSLALNSMVLLVGTGIVLVPGAILGVVGTFERPLRREQTAFGALAVTVTVALLLQASIYGDTNVAQTRYTFYLVPLWVVAFALFAEQGWRRKRYFALIGVALLTTLLSSPLTTIAAGRGKVHAPELFATARLQELFHQNAGTTSVAILGGLAVVVFAAALAAAVDRRAGTIVALCGAAGAMLATSFAAYSFDGRNTKNVVAAFTGTAPSWVDELHSGATRLVAMPNDLRDDTLEQLFWNRSIDRVTLLPNTVPVDMLPTQVGSFTGDGRLLTAGKPTLGPVLLDEYGTSAQLAGATRLGSDPTSELYRPRGALRFRLIAVGEYYDHWLASRGGLVIFPSAPGGTVSGRVVLTVRDPLGTAPAALVFHGRTVSARFRVTSSKPRTLSFPVCTNGATTIAFAGSVTGQLGDGRIVSVQSLPPRFVADSRACAA